MGRQRKESLSNYQAPVLNDEEMMNDIYLMISSYKKADLTCQCLKIVKIHELEIKVQFSSSFLSFTVCCFLFFMRRIFDQGFGRYSFKFGFDIEFLLDWRKIVLYLFHNLSYFFQRLFFRSFLRHIRHDISNFGQFL